MNFNTILILVWVLFGSILIIENMVVPLQAYVIIWITKSYMLAIASIATGILIGYGLRGKIDGDSKPAEDDTYGF